MTETSHKKFLQLKIYIVVFGAYLFFLLTLPYVNELITPCLKYSPGATYAFDDCTVPAVLDHFLLAVLVGFAISVILVFILQRKNGVKPILIFSLLLALVTIAGYYAYIPRALSQVKNAPVVLESLLEKK